MERQLKNVLMHISAMARRCWTSHVWRMGCWGMPFREVRAFIFCLYRHVSKHVKLLMNPFLPVCQFWHKFLLYPPQNEVLGGYTVFSLSVIP